MSQHPVRPPAPLAFNIFLTGCLLLSCGGDKGGNAGNGSGSTGSDRAGSGGSSGGSGGNRGGSGGDGGSASGGSGGSSSGGGGGSTSVGGAGGGAGPAAMGPAVLKFCNALSLANQQKIDLTLEIGAEPLRMVATSGECTPVTKMACTPATAGMGPIRLLLDGELLFETEIDVPASGEYMLLATLDEMTMQPFVEPFAFMPGAKCSDFDFSVFADPDGGVGDAGGGSMGGAGGGGGTVPPRFFPAPREKGIFQSPFRRLDADPRVVPFGR